MCQNLGSRLYPVSTRQCWQLALLLASNALPETEPDSLIVEGEEDNESISPGFPNRPSAFYSLLLLAESPWLQRLSR
jgi:hypothetical protein